MSRHRKISPCFTCFRILKLYNGGFIKKTVGHYLFKYYCYLSPLSSPLGTLGNSIMPFQFLSKSLIPSFIVYVALSLCATLSVITVITAKKKKITLRRMVNMEKKVSDRKCRIRKSGIISLSF